MARQNRITPAGDLIATSARGRFMGNRGVLHNSQGDLTKRRWTHQQWIICTLEFKGRKRPIMAPGCYTELFFLDEATALAAGHRPCWECNRERYKKFKQAWLSGNPEYGFDQKVSIREIDKIIHSERVDKSRLKVTWQSQLANLPDGVFVYLPDDSSNCYLLNNDSLQLWSPNGYEYIRKVSDKIKVDVLTPKSTVNAIISGFKPLFNGVK